MSEANKTEVEAARAVSNRKYNHLAAAEISEEENYNQIDGIINNTKKPSILDHLRNYKPLPNERGGKPEKGDEREK